MQKQPGHTIPQIRTATATLTAPSSLQPVDEITKLLAKHMDDILFCLTHRVQHRTYCVCVFCILYFKHAAMVIGHWE